MSEEIIEILYNACRGGFGLSDKARTLYKQRTVENGCEYDDDCDFYDRTDPLLVQLFHELGNDFNNECSRIKAKNIPLKYERYYTIYSEYDGRENIVIDYELYEADLTIIHIKTILQNDKCNDDKIIELNKMFIDKITF